MPPKLTRALFIPLLIAFLAGCAGTGASQPKAARTDQMSNRGQANLRLAYSYLNAGKMELAVDRAQRGLESDPDSPDLYVVMGLIQARLGADARAGEHYARAARLGGDRGDILNVHAVWLCEQGRHAEAKAQFARAIEDLLNETRPQVLYNAALCARKSGDLATAEAELRQALAARPEDPASLALMAEIQYELGNAMGARAFLQRREAAGEATPGLLELGAKIETAAGDTAAADRYRQRLRELFPDHTPNATEGSRQP